LNSNNISARWEELVADPDQVRLLDAHAARFLRTQTIASINDSTASVST